MFITRTNLETIKHKYTLQKWVKSVSERVIDAIFTTMITI